MHDVRSDTPPWEKPTILTLASMLKTLPSFFLGSSAGNNLFLISFVKYIKTILVGAFVQWYQNLLSLCMQNLFFSDLVVIFYVP